MARVVVMAPNWLGDAVMALPALVDLRRGQPHATIHVAARASVAPLYTMVPEVDGVLALNGRGGWSALSDWQGHAASLARGEYDAAFLFPNSFASALAVRLASIRERVGFAADGRGWLLTRAFPRPRAFAHQAEYYQQLIAAALGQPPGPRFARIRVGAAPRERALQQLHAAGLPGGGPFVALAPGAAYGSAKQWLPERFAELARLLHAAGKSSVLVGSLADARVCARITSLAGGADPAPAPGPAPAHGSPPTRPVIDLSGHTDLTTLAGVLALAEVCVSNDSGAMHLAGAVGTRVVALFGPTNERRTSPLTASADASPPSIVSTSVFCRPCMLRECPIDHRCMTRISAADVARLVEGEQ